MSNALKLLVLAASTIVTCVVIAVTLTMSNESKRLGEAMTENINDFYDDISNEDIMMYDGLIVTGSDVINILKKYLGAYHKDEKAPFYISVEKSKDYGNFYSYYNKEYFSRIQDYSSEQYINPCGQYQGHVAFNDNQVISNVTFTIYE